MVYFEISRAGLNCGFDKEECSEYPSHCNKCIKNRLLELGFELHTNIRITEMDSEEKRLEMYRDAIWQKFWDVLNIKHIIITSTKSGLAMIDYPITGAGLDVSLLTGFIQANITFSESGSTSNTNISEHEATKRQFYEFDYKDFIVLLKEGTSISLCLVLENTASESLKSTVNELIREFETIYYDKIRKYENSGSLNFNNAIEFIIESFNVKLVFPMVLSHTVPPSITERVNQNYVQSAILTLAKELLINKPFFFINNILNNVQDIVEINAKTVLYEIYQLLEMNVIIPTPLDVAENKFKTFKENRAMNLAKNTSLSSILTNDNEFEELKQQVEDMDSATAENLMEKYIKKGKTAEEALIYQAALKEYEKALYLASGFNFEENIGKISFMILEVEKKINDMELEYAKEAAEKAEKRRDYITSIRNYRKAIDILEIRLTEVQVNPEEIESKIRKIKKKISKLEGRM